MSHAQKLIQIVTDPTMDFDQKNEALVAAIEQRVRKGDRPVLRRICTCRVSHLVVCAVIGSVLTMALAAPQQSFASQEQEVRHRAAEVATMTFWKQADLLLTLERIDPRALSRLGYQIISWKNSGIASDDLVARMERRFTEVVKRACQQEREEDYYARLYGTDSPDE